MKKIIFVSLVSILLAGCLEPASKINAVSLGMSKDQVLKIMGQPGSITSDTNSIYFGSMHLTQVGGNQGFAMFVC